MDSDDSLPGGWSDRRIEGFQGLEARAQGKVFHRLEALEAYATTKGFCYRLDSLYHYASSFTGWKPMPRAGSAGSLDHGVEAYATKEPWESKRPIDVTSFV